MGLEIVISVDDNPQADSNTSAQFVRVLSEQVRERLAPPRFGFRQAPPSTAAASSTSQDVLPFVFLKRVRSRAEPYLTLPPSSPPVYLMNYHTLASSSHQIIFNTNPWHPTVVNASMMFIGARHG